MPGGGIEVDPLVGLDDKNKPLRSRLLAVPALKKKYLEHVRTLANDWLDWKKLQPVVRKTEALIGKEVEADTRKLSSYVAFQRALGEDTAEPMPPERPEGGGFGPPRRSAPSLKAFAEKRRTYLLNHPEIKKLDSP